MGLGELILGLKSAPRGRPVGLISELVGLISELVGLISKLVGLISELVGLISEPPKL